MGSTCFRNLQALSSVLATASGPRVSTSHRSLGLIIYYIDITSIIFNHIHQKKSIYYRQVVTLNGQIKEVCSVFQDSTLFESGTIQHYTFHKSCLKWLFCRCC